MTSTRASDERKLVTVLFADLVRSTQLVVERDAEDVRAMLHAFFEEMAREVRAFGGTVEKYAGDAIMAVFGGGGPAPGRRAQSASGTRRDQAGFLAPRSATGKPALFHAANPPSISVTRSRPICWAVSAARAERHAPLQ